MKPTLKNDLFLDNDAWLYKGPVDPYWESCKNDIFKTDQYYQTRFKDDCFYEEWDILAFMIQQGQVEEIKQKLRHDREFSTKTFLRDSGDTILHIAAEYGQYTLF